MSKYYEQAEQTLSLVEEVLSGRYFYVFGSFARRKFDSQIEFGQEYDLDILLDANDFGYALEDFSKRGSRLQDTSIIVPNEGIFSEELPSERELRAEKAHLPSYTQIHLVELPHMNQTVSWMSESLRGSIKTDRGVNYLLLPKKREFTDLDRQVWEHNFKHYH